MKPDAGVRENVPFHVYMAEVLTVSEAEAAEACLPPCSMPR